MIFANKQEFVCQELIEHFTYTSLFFQKSNSEILLNFSDKKLYDKIFKDTELIYKSNIFIHFALKILLDNNLLDDNNNSQ